MTGCDDVAIVGAGIAGTYAAWKLRNKNQTITIYEYSNRVGGKHHSTKIAGVPDFEAELGCLRFRTTSNPLLTKLIDDLGLKVLDFEYVGYAKIDTTWMYLRGVHMRYKDLFNSGMPYKLRPEEMTSQFQMRWEAYANNTDRLTNKASSKYYVKTLDGVPLYKQSMQSALSKSVSTEAWKFLRDISGWRSMWGDINGIFMFTRPDPATFIAKPNPVKTVENGMGTIPKALLKEFLEIREGKNKHKITMNRQLTAIKKQTDGTYLLTFMSTRTSDGITAPVNVERKQCAKKVVLAIPRLPLETLDWSGLRQPHIRDFIMNAVKDTHGAKIYFAYTEPWWRKAVSDFNYAISDTPLVQTFEYETTKVSNISILNVAYLDSDVSLWDEIRKRGNPINGAEDSTLAVTDEMVTLVHGYLSEIFNISVKDIPQPVGATMKIWKSFPYGGSWQHWMPGYIWTDVERQMIKPSVDDDVYVATSAFNSRSQSYVSEGALETVDLMLDRWNQ